LVTPWVETIPKTNAYHNASSQGKEQWLKWAAEMDKRVSRLKTNVKVVLHESSRLAYCIGSKYGKWVNLPRGKHPYPTFWIHFVEYHYQDYAWKDHQEYYQYSLQEKREQAWREYFETWVVKWAKKKMFQARPNHINSSDFTVKFYGLPNYYEYGTFYSNCDYCMVSGCSEWSLREEGFNPPAMAEKPRPQKFHNPETFMLLGADDE
jgi:hypothetical protein